jgi:cytoskeleton protein RodZ
VDQSLRPIPPLSPGDPRMRAGEGVGNRLFHARQQAGLSLEEVAARTKITEFILEAIEHEQFGRLPGGCCRRGFLRAYAREVRLDAESIVRQYVAEFEPDTIPPAPASPPAVSPEPLVDADDNWSRQLVLPALLLAVAFLLYSLAS